MRFYCVGIEYVILLYKTFHCTRAPHKELLHAPTIMLVVVCSVCPVCPVCLVCSVYDGKPSQVNFNALFFCFTVFLLNVTVYIN